MRLALQGNLHLGERKPSFDTALIGNKYLSNIEHSKHWWAVHLHASFLGIFNNEFFHGMDLSRLLPFYPPSESLVKTYGSTGSVLDCQDEVLGQTLSQQSQPLGSGPLAHSTVVALGESVHFSDCALLVALRDWEL